MVIVQTKKVMVVNGVAVAILKRNYYENNHIVI